MKNLRTVSESILAESLITDVAKLLDMEEDRIESQVDQLSFSDYLELGNAVSNDDSDLVKEILQLDDAMQERSHDDDDDEDELYQFDDGDDDYDDDDDGFDMGLGEDLADTDVNIHSWGKVDPDFATDPAYKIVLQTPGGKQRRYRSLNDLKRGLAIGFRKNPSLWDDIKAGKTSWTLVRNDLDELEEADNAYGGAASDNAYNSSGAVANRQGAMDDEEEDDEEDEEGSIGNIDVSDEDEPTVDVKGEDGKTYTVKASNIEESDDYNEDDSVKAVKDALYHRIGRQHLDLIDKYGIDAVNKAIEWVAYFYGSDGLDEIGSSDVSAFVDSVKQELEIPNMFENSDLARMRALAGLPAQQVTESARYGIYRKSKMDWEGWQNDGWKGNTQAASAKVKRGGEHLTFKSKGAAEKWIKDNAKGEEMFARKVSKPVKEARTPHDGHWLYVKFGREHYLIDWLEKQHGRYANIIDSKKAPRGYVGLWFSATPERSGSRAGGEKAYRLAKAHAEKKGWLAPEPQMETASSGGTGAGAIASGPVAVGGTQKRTDPSIYAQKPKPKKKGKKSKKNEGLGRNKKQ